MRSIYQRPPPSLRSYSTIQRYFEIYRYEALRRFSTITSKIDIQDYARCSYHLHHDLQAFASKPLLKAKKKIGGGAFSPTIYRNQTRRRGTETSSKSFAEAEGQPCTSATGPACLSDFRLLKESIPAQLYSSTHPCVNAQEKHPYLEFYFRTSNAGYKCATRISNVPSFQHLPDFRRHRSSIPSNINVGASNYQSNRSYIEHPVSNIITSEYPRSWER
ncbi:uncharacterized protein LOC118738098 [Rhagoletis pomonella]|uniref:uncharacterized protein LOC118738098 n=1 Tax=Rhagoletis pomonella TaxID=28610 RepID=UPI00178096C3|nr:uncharacterized protein LOC118738098 [Rhagoletis pomonella]